MTIKSLLGILLISSTVLTSCKKELEPQDSSDAVAPAQSTAAATPTTQQQLQQSQIVQAQSPVQPVATTAVAAGMNPPHGQPNHRCDIAVGAPLNSAPSTTPAVQNPAQSVSKTTTITPTQPAKTTVVAAGMNPPHGQPNHRCDIAVGAPLNSPVANKAPSGSTTIQPTAAPAAAYTPNTITASHTAPVMNPAHGQPGHTCAVAVGAPIPSTTTE